MFRVDNLSTLHIELDPKEAGCGTDKISLYTATAKDTLGQDL